jgi:hypothetical protein
LDILLVINFKANKDADNKLCFEEVGDCCVTATDGAVTCEIDGSALDDTLQVTEGHTTGDDIAIAGVIINDTGLQGKGSVEY